MNKQYELEFFYFPGCIVAANKLHDEHGDREQLALIDYCGLILWQKDPAGLPEEIRHNINLCAAGELDAFRAAYLTKPYLRALSDFPDCFWFRNRDRIHQAKTTGDLYRLYMELYQKAGRWRLPDGVQDPAELANDAATPGLSVAH